MKLFFKDALRHGFSVTFTISQTLYLNKIGRHVDYLAGDINITGILHIWFRNTHEPKLII